MKTQTKDLLSNAIGQGKKLLFAALAPAVIAGYFFTGSALNAFPYDSNYTHEERMVLSFEHGWEKESTYEMVLWPLLIAERWSECKTITQRCAPDYRRYCARFVEGSCPDTHSLDGMKQLRLRFPVDAGL